MYWMRSFADELTKIAAAGAMAAEASPFLLKHWKPLAATAGGALGFHELQKLKKKLELGDMVYRQQYGS